MSTIKIRDANKDDEIVFRNLWQGFLDFYKVDIAPEVTTFTWERLLDPNNALSLRLAQKGGRVLGFAIYHHHPSTWVMGDDCYLEDLYVTPEARGQGIAHALMDDLFALARGKGWKRLYWNTDADNEVARALYDQYAKDDGHVRYRVTL